MTPKEEAVQMVTLFYNVIPSIDCGDLDILASKKIALLAVDKIIESDPRFPSNVDWEGAGESFQYHKEAKKREEAKKYWREVKQQIENL
jgi:hypothetical protein